MSTAGSITRASNGTWAFIVDVPGMNGKRRQLRRRGFITKKAAQAELTAVLNDVHRGAYVRPSRMTLGMYLTERWLPARRVDLRASTALGYEKLIASRIVPLLGDVPLHRLDAASLEAFYGDLLGSGGGNGGPLAAKTVANTAGLLSIALADAVRLKVIPHNPSADARLPRRTRSEMMAWNESEAASFLASVAGDRRFPLWRLALATGLRRGELCGLRWKDVDLAAGTLSVASTRVVAHAVVTGEPKTKAGARVVSVDRETVVALSSWRRRQAEERLAAGGAWSDSGLVFVDGSACRRTQRRSLVGGVKQSPAPASRRFGFTTPGTPPRRSCCAPACP